MIPISRQEELVRIAQKEADKAVKKGNSPFGAVLTDANGKIIVKAHNTQNSDMDPAAHAEINLLRKAGKLLKSRYLEGTHIFGNAEACSMCMSACIKAHIRHFYYGAPAEPSMDPMLPAKTVAEKTKRNIYLYPQILANDCTEQIAKARKKLSKKSS